MPSPLRSLAIPLLTMSLVFGVPRHVLFMSAEPGREGYSYGTASTAPNASEQAPREITPDQELTLPAIDEVDPDPENGATGSTGYQISP
jgi:hypothetical protein